MANTPRVAIVTGAGSGIGRAVAVALSQQGYAVAAAGRRRDALEATVAMAGSGDMLAVACDVTDQASVRKLFAQTKAAFGRLDVVRQCWHRNAAYADGRYSTRSMEARCRHQSHRRLSVHAGSHPHDEGAKSAGGRIINNGSISAHAPDPFRALYVDEARDNGSHQIHSPGRTAFRYRLRTDRHRQCGDPT